MKVIVSIIHDRHYDDHLTVQKYTTENLQALEGKYREYYPDGKWGMYGDLPCEDGDQFGVNEDYYCSYAIVDVK